MDEIEIVRDRGVLSLIRQGENILADGGFHGESALLIPFRKTKEKPLNEEQLGKYNVLLLLLLLLLFLQVHPH